MPRTQMEDFRDPTLQPKRTSSELISSSTAATGYLWTNSQPFHPPSLPSSPGARSATGPYAAQHLAPAQLSTWQLQPRAAPLPATPQHRQTPSSRTHLNRRYKNKAGATTTRQTGGHVAEVSAETNKKQHKKQFKEAYFQKSFAT